MQYQRRNEIESAEMAEEVLLYDPASVKFCALNSTAAFVWQRLQGSRSLESLLSDVAHGYSVPDDGDVKRDLVTILDELTRLSFVDRVDAPADPASDVPDRTSMTEPPRYVAPRVRVMDETEVLSEFQVTSAGTTWWIM